MHNNKIHFILECMTILKLENIMKNGDDVDEMRDIIMSSYSKLVGDIDLAIRRIKLDCVVAGATTVRTDYRFAYNIENIIDVWCHFNYDRIKDVLPNENGMLIMECVVGSEYGSHLHRECLAMLQEACVDEVPDA